MHQYWKMMDNIPSIVHLTKLMIVCLWFHSDSDAHLTVVVFFTGISIAPNFNRFPCFVKLNLERKRKWPIGSSQCQVFIMKFRNGFTIRVKICSNLNNFDELIRISTINLMLTQFGGHLFYIEYAHVHYWSTHIFVLYLLWFQPQKMNIIMAAYICFI